MKVPDRIEDLIIAELAGETSLEEKKMLKEWLAESPENQKYYTEYYSLWYRGVVGKQKAGNADERIWQEIEQKHLRRKYSRIFYWGCAVAASLAILFGGIHFLTLQEVTQSKVTTVADLVNLRQPGEVKLILSSGREIVVTGKARLEEGQTAIESDSTGLIYSGQGKDDDTAHMIYNELIVPKCGEYRLILSDGTTILMNAESQLRYPVRFTGKAREVWLSGEAYFDVVHREEQPFIVHLEKAAVKVLGTSFNVMAYKDEINAEITLIQGCVDVGAAGHHELLMPGNQVALDNTTLRMTNRKVDVSQYIAWKEGILRFDDMPLEQLMNRLSRWYDIDFQFQQEELKAKVFSGGFRKYEPIERILDMIQQTNDVKFRVQNDKVVIDKR